MDRGAWLQSTGSQRSDTTERLHFLSLSLSLSNLLHQGETRWLYGCSFCCLLTGSAVPGQGTYLGDMFKQTVLKSGIVNNLT